MSYVLRYMVIEIIFYRRVYAQLASECEEDESEQNRSTDHQNDSSTLHSVNANDLETVPHSAVWNNVPANSAACIANNNTLPHKKSRKSLSCQQSSLHCDKASKSENDLYNDSSDKPSMDWSSFEQQIKLISEKMERKHPTRFHNTNSQHMSTRQSLGRKSNHQVRTGAAFK